MRLTAIGDHTQSVRKWNPKIEAPDDEFIYIDIASVSQENKEVNGVSHLLGSDAPSRARQLVNAGDVVVSTVRPNLNAVAYIPEELDGATASTGFSVLRSNPKHLEPRYLYHWVRSQEFVSTMVKQATGQSYPAVSDKIVKRSKIPLPSLVEQKRIAAILDQADALHRLRQRAIKRLNNLGQAIFHEMFGDPYTNPKQFERQPLSGIIKFIGGSQPPKSTFVYEGGKDVVRLVQIRDFRTDEYKTYVPKNLAKRPFTEDDVMIGRYGPPVFQILRGLSGTYNVALMKAQPLEGVTKDFVYFLLKEPRLHNYVVSNSERTAGQSGVNLELLNKYPAYKPPTEVQHEFSRRINALNHKQRKSLESLDKAKALFHSLQNQAFRGEL